MTLFANEQHDGALTLIAGEKKIQFESFHKVSKWQSHSELVNNLMANTNSFNELLQTANACLVKVMKTDV